MTFCCHICQEISNSRQAALEHRQTHLNTTGTQTERQPSQPATALRREDTRRHQPYQRHDRGGRERERPRRRREEPRSRRQWQPAAGPTQPTPRREVSSVLVPLPSLRDPLGLTDPSTTTTAGDDDDHIDLLAPLVDVEFVDP